MTLTRLFHDYAVHESLLPPADQVARPGWRSFAAHHPSTLLLLGVNAASLAYFGRLKALIRSCVPPSAAAASMDAGTSRAVLSGAAAVVGARKLLMFQNHFAMSYDNFFVRRRWWTMISSGFMHSGPMHLFMNVAAMASVGMDIWGLLGDAKAWCLYLSALAVSSTSSIVLRRIIAGPSFPYGSIGASGGLFALWTVRTLLFPEEFLRLTLPGWLSPVQTRAETSDHSSPGPDDDGDNDLDGERDADAGRGSSRSVVHLSSKAVLLAALGIDVVGLAVFGLRSRIDHLSHLAGAAWGAAVHAAFLSRQSSSEPMLQVGTQDIYYGPTAGYRPHGAFGIRIHHLNQIQAGSFVRGALCGYGMERTKIGSRAEVFEVGIFARGVPCGPLLRSVNGDEAVSFLSRRSGKNHIRDGFTVQRAPFRAPLAAGGGDGAAEATAPSDRLALRDSVLSFMRSFELENHLHPTAAMGLSFARYHKHLLGVSFGSLRDGPAYLLSHHGFTFLESLDPDAASPVFCMHFMKLSSESATHARDQSPLSVLPSWTESLLTAGLYRPDPSDVSSSSARSLPLFMDCGFVVANGRHLLLSGPVQATNVLRVLADRMQPTTGSTARADDSHWMELPVLEMVPEHRHRQWLWIWDLMGYSPGASDCASG